MVVDDDNDDDNVWDYATEGWKGIKDGGLMGNDAYYIRLIIF